MSRSKKKNNGGHPATRARIERSRFNPLQLVRVNLPFSEEMFEKGNGETIWMQLTERDMRRYGANEAVEVIAAAKNDSHLYADVRYGEELRILLRPGRKPLAIFDGQLSSRTLNTVGAHTWGTGGVLETFPEHAVWQVRPMTQDERIAHLSGADMLGCENLWVAPGEPASRVRAYVDHLRHHHGCASHNH